MSLNSLIERSIESGNHSPVDIANETSRLVRLEWPESERDELFRDLLTDRVRNYVNTRRRSIASGKAKSVLGGQPRAARRDAVAHAGDKWRSYMSSLLSTEGGYKPIAECSEDDFLWAAGVRRSQAAGMVAEAAKLEKLAAACGEFGVSRAGDLPEGCVELF